MLGELNLNFLYQSFKMHTKPKVMNLPYLAGNLEGQGALVVEELQLALVDLLDDLDDPLDVPLLLLQVGEDRAAQRGSL